MTETPLPRPEARYGRARLSRVPRRWVVLTLGALVLVAGVAIAVLGYQRIGTSDVTGSLAGYRVIDDHTASVTISVTRSDPARPVDCIVRVRARDGSETGRRELLVPPAQTPTVQVTTTVTSSQPPMVADIYGCGTDVPAYLRPQAG
ncbi:hypothetical protein A5714_01080 [Mycobacterium sp. E2462]|uniref:DUF4307 domain-containing protein n=1 Tax=unclassified Mycobacterium TaxID=2642494 RepID=UPI0007FCAA6F|nr:MULTISPECIES: DUF4307 domain-containing protein [unclassified Mycobacterium]OBG72517.1 hypothetical protein A5700_09020 [Mycobacterium sp. E1214]OBH29695.1 hypothetical protein A5693_19575 [Mycobacterium sp. E1319]OBI18370.1 hypothetical protein A5714_01080 [Mycobacterium sp. E2462]